jgi:hypothetical protein
MRTSVSRPVYAGHSCQHGTRVQRLLAPQQRFGRGPTPSEEELGEEQWDGIAEKAAQASQKGLSLPTFTLLGHVEAGKSE